MSGSDCETSSLTLCRSLGFTSCLFVHFFVCVSVYVGLCFLKLLFYYVCAMLLPTMCMLYLCCFMWQTLCFMPRKTARINIKHCAVIPAATTSRNSRLHVIATPRSDQSPCRISISIKSSTLCRDKRGNSKPLFTKATRLGKASSLASGQVSQLENQHTWVTARNWCRVAIHCGNR